MAGQKGVHVLEDKLAPFLAVERDTSSPQGFAEYFCNATMRSLAQLTVDTHPTVAPAS